MGFPVSKFTFPKQNKTSPCAIQISKSKFIFCLQDTISSLRLSFLGSELPGSGPQAKNVNPGQEPWPGPMI